jgi:hypothetical protein
MIRAPFATRRLMDAVAIVNCQEMIVQLVRVVGVYLLPPPNVSSYLHFHSLGTVHTRLSHALHFALGSNLAAGCNVPAVSSTLAVQVGSLFRTFIFYLFVLLLVSNSCL